MWGKAVGEKCYGKIKVVIQRSENQKSTKTDEVIDGTASRHSFKKCEVPTAALRRVTPINSYEQL